MGEHHVGLDIGSFAVRAAEVSREAGVPVLHRFAQITLPPRSVVEGEILDRDAVSAAIRQLWAKGGFKTRTVVVGVSNRDVKVRQAEVPDLSPEEVRSALRYETQDVLPFADEDSVVDFLVQERFVRDDTDMLRVLVVAAPKTRIDDAVTVARQAGLVVEGVDLTPFALVRALASPRPGGGGEIIVSVGAGLTSVVVHTHGIPQLVRTTPGGGGAITDALSASLEVDYEQAEAIKRTGSAHTADGGRVAALIETQLDTLVRDISGSVDYFVAQTTEANVQRILLTGAGSLVPGLRERIGAAVNLAVLPADALTNVTLGKTRLTPEQLVAASTTLAGPIGLALAPLADPTSRLTALLPQRYVEHLRTRREIKIAAAAMCAVAVVLAGLYAKRTFDVRTARGNVTHVVHRQHALQSREAQFAALARQETELTRRSAALTGLLTQDADPSAILDQISAAIPPDVWLQSVQLTLPSGKSSGTATFSLSGVDGDSPARWLEAMRGLTSTFSSVWVTTISQGGSPTRPVVTFSSQATLAPGVLSHRAAAYQVPK